MQEQIQTALSTVNLASLAAQLSKDFNLKLTIAPNSQKEEETDIDLVLEYKPNLECLTIARNYSEDLLDYEQFSAYHSLVEDNEQTRVHYHGSKLDYFKNTFQDIKDKENEFILSLRADYEEILREWSKKSKGGIHYVKRISNDQKTLEELFNYATFKFKGIKSSI